MADIKFGSRAAEGGTAADGTHFCGVYTFDNTFLVDLSLLGLVYGVC